MVGSAAGYAMALLGVGTQIVLVDADAALSPALRPRISPTPRSIRHHRGYPCRRLFRSQVAPRWSSSPPGVNQKPGENRLALLERNVEVFNRSVIRGRDDRLRPTRFC
jgi:L-lactate dehydrogenase